ncbi:hypothetical protein C1H46_028407 [Malus baccata]|uniref:Uncharacterized protein n=1 Tax=Malus baccata TaxID=106549 RepID=A0A540LHT0_MALBA|nr:hypothetical protein C1H46_028407 [Malus baccata]
MENQGSFICFHRFLELRIASLRMKVLDLLIFDSASPLLYLTFLEGRMDREGERGQRACSAFFGVNGLPHEVAEQRISKGGMGEERVFSFVL